VTRRDAPHKHPESVTPLHFYPLRTVTRDDDLLGYRGAPLMTVTRIGSDRMTISAAHRVRSRSRSSRCVEALGVAANGSPRSSDRRAVRPRLPLRSEGGEDGARGGGHHLPRLLDGGVRRVGYPLDQPRNRATVTSLRRPALRRNRAVASRGHRGDRIDVFLFLDAAPPVRLRLFGLHSHNREIPPKVFQTVGSAKKSREICRVDEHDVAGAGLARRHPK
jgi:hypothetical protein